MFRIFRPRYRMILLSAAALFFSAFIPDCTLSENNTQVVQPRVYVFEIRDDISKPALKVTQKAFKEAEQLYVEKI